MLEEYEMDASYCCTQCSHQSVWKFQLDHHMQINHEHVNYANELFDANNTEPELYTCYCGSFQSFYKLSLYDHHMRQHVEVTTTGANIIERPYKFETYPCPTCQYKGHYSGLSLIKRHGACKKPTSRSSTSNISTKSFRCARCPYESRFKSNLMRHAVKHVSAAEIAWFDCAKCSYRAKHKADVRKHDLFKHVSAADIVWFDCVECPYRAKAKGNLKKHVLMRHRRPDDVDSWFGCGQCFYRTTHKGNLKSHMLQHAAADEIDWFHCAKCSFRAKVKRNLDMHMLQHAADDEIRWFGCTECSYRAKQKAHLKTHMLRHVAADDVEWFDCALCSYRSKRKEHLKSHMRTHLAPDDDETN